MNVLRKTFLIGLVIGFAMSLSAAANAATGPQANPWGDAVTSDNTDPRVDLVAVNGIGEGQQFIAGCSGSTLYKGRVAQEIGDPLFTLEKQSFAEECSYDGPPMIAEGATPSKPRMINTDYNAGWVIKPDRSGGDASIGRVCAGTVGVIFTFIGGSPYWEPIPGVGDCAKGQIV